MSPFAPSRPEYLLPSYAMGPETPMVVTLVDLTPLTSDDPFFHKAEVARRYRSRLQLVEQAELILTISSNTRREAIELLGVNPRRVVNIGTGVSDGFGPPGPHDDPAGTIRRDLPRISKPFILSVTGTWDWKNTDRLVEAYALLPNDLRSRFQLVVVCRLTEEYRSRWMGLARRLGLGSDGIVLTNLVSEPTLTALYQSADLFVFPSLYEGFGLPAAEAAACGCPTITSNTSSMPEILDFPEATFDPRDPGSMAPLIERALADKDFNQALRRAAAMAAARNTWEAVAARTSDALSLLPDPHLVSSVGSRPRVALALPLGPSSNGDTSGVLDVAKEMASICDLDLLAVSAQERDRMHEVSGARCFPLDALGEQLNPAAYDAIVYGLGPEGHTEIERSAVRYPGVLWMGEVSLLDCHPRFGHGPSMWGRAVEAAIGVLGTSDVQLRLIALDRGPGARMPPCRTIPSAEQDARGAAESILDFVRLL
jgi:glycosyltransferase involved in cell wall biosynthesis